MTKIANTLKTIFSSSKYVFHRPMIVTILLAMVTVLSGYIYHQMQYVEAIDLQMANSSSITRLIQKGGALLNESRYDDAISYYDQALKINPKSADALNGKGLALNELARYDEALLMFDKALVLQPNLVSALNNKGITLVNLGKYEEAITWFNKAIDIDPNFVDALYNKGGALGELGKYGEAAMWTDKALAIDSAKKNIANSSNVLLPNE